MTTSDTPEIAARRPTLTAQLIVRPANGYRIAPPHGEMEAEP